MHGVLHGKPVARPCAEVAERGEPKNASTIDRYEHRVAQCDPGAPPLGAVFEGDWNIGVDRRRGGNHVVVDSEQAGEIGDATGYDGAVRWRKGERLEQLFEERCEELRREDKGDALAVDGPEAALVYVPHIRAGEQY